MRGAHSFGEELCWFEANGIRISETVMPAGMELDEHTHPSGQICFVLEGEYDERTANGVRHLTPGRMQVHAPGERHANRFYAGSDVLTLLVSIDRARWVDISPGGHLRASAMLADNVAEIRRELIRGDIASRAALEGLALLLLSRTARASIEMRPDEPEWLADAVVHIELHYDSALSLSSIAETAGVHRATLSAAFRRFRSTSVGDYIREVRVRNAAGMLQTGRTLDEIAIATGFSDQPHFGRVFKKVTGQTPGAFRARNCRIA